MFYHYKETQYTDFEWNKGTFKNCHRVRIYVTKHWSDDLSLPQTLKSKLSSIKVKFENSINTIILPKNNYIVKI